METQIRRAAARAARLDGVHGIVLFGSVVRGEAQEHSDCDVAVVARHEEVKGHVERLLADLVDGPVQTHWMGPWNQYGGAYVWGRVGREALATGKIIEDDGTVQAMRETQPRKLTGDEMADNLNMLLVDASAMCRTAIELHDAGGTGNEGQWRRRLAADSASTAETVLKHACLVRGHTALWEHTADRIIGKRSGPLLIPEREEGEHGAYLRALAEQLDGHGKRDHQATYFGGKTELTEASLLRRVGHTLRALREECDRACEAFGVEAIRKAIGEGVDGLRTTLRAGPQDVETWPEATALWEKPVGAEVEKAQAKALEKAKRAAKRCGRKGQDPG